MSEQPDGSTLLPDWFVPSNLDVIVGWARQNHQHLGNQRFRQIIDRSAPNYLAARNKLEKSQVIAAVIDKIRSDSPGGGFVRKDFYSGRWYEIGDEKARDKVGHAVRKAAEQLLKQGQSSSRSTTTSASAQIRSSGQRDRVQNLPAAARIQQQLPHGGIHALAAARGSPMTGSVGHGVRPGVRNMAELVAQTQLSSRGILPTSTYDLTSLLPTMPRSLPPLVYQNPYSYLASMLPLQLTQQADPLLQNSLPNVATAAAAATLMARSQAGMSSLSGITSHQAVPTPSQTVSNFIIPETQHRSSVRRDGDRVHPILPTLSTSRTQDRPLDSSSQLPPIAGEATHGMTSHQAMQINVGGSALRAAHLSNVGVVSAAAHLPNILPMNISTSHISALVRSQAGDGQQIDRVQPTLRMGRERPVLTEDTEISKQQSSDEEDRKLPASTSKTK